jgi:ESX secretion system protein EccE
MPEPSAERAAGRPGVAQWVAVECVLLVAALAAYQVRSVAAAVPAAAAAIVLLAVIGRPGRRWTYEELAAWALLRRRRREVARALAGPVGHRHATLAALAPDLSVVTASDRGRPVGVGRDQLGWFAALALSPRDGLSGSGEGGLRLGPLAALVADKSVPVSSCQLLFRQTAMPGPAVDPGAPAASSYRRLVGALAVPAQREVWIALRLTPADAAIAAASRGGGVAGVHRALLSVLGRIGATLHADKVEHRVLDALGLLRALNTTCVPEVAGRAVPGLATLEHWDRWQTGAAVHVSFAVEYRSRGRTGAPLVEWAYVPGAIAVTTALVIRRQRAGRDAPAGVLLRTVVRVSAPPESIEACVKHLAASADSLGVRLVRLDGEQAAAVYATAPTGAPIGLQPW